MAGAGAKKFPAFSKLSSDDVNNYLADQVIMRFATTAARDAAFGGVGEPTLAEGMTAYIDADNSIYTYDGSNWVKMVSATTPPALELIRTVTPTPSTTVAVNQCFSSAFTNYRIIASPLGVSLASDIRFKLRSGVTPNSTEYYMTNIFCSGGTISSTSENNQTSWRAMFTGANFSNFGALTIDIFSPNVATQTRYIMQGSGWDGSSVINRSSTGFHFVGNSFDGFELFSTTGGADITATISVYGYRN